MGYLYFLLQFKHPHSEDCRRSVEADGCEQLAQSRYAAEPWPGIELATSRDLSRSPVRRPTIAPSNHPTRLTGELNVIPQTLRATRQSQRLRVCRAMKSQRTRATKSRDKIAGVTSL